MANKIIYDFSEFSRQQKKKDTFLKINNKEYKVNYNSFVSLELVELQRNKDISESEIAKKIFEIGLGEKASKEILELKDKGIIDENGITNIIGTLLFLLLEVKTPEDIIKINKINKKKEEKNVNNYNYILDDWMYIEASFAYDYGIVLNKEILSNMSPSTFFNLISQFSSDSQMGKIWALENTEMKDLTNEQQNFIINRRLMKEEEELKSLF